MASTIVVFDRKFQILNAIFPIGVFIDDKRVGTLWNGQVKEFGVTPGKYTAKIGMFEFEEGSCAEESKEIAFRIDYGETAKFTVKLGLKLKLIFDGCE